MNTTGETVLSALAVAGPDGFLGTRGSLMLDAIFLALLAVVPALAVSWYLVRSRRLYQAHKRIQLVLATLLLVVVAAFELEIRLYGWQGRARSSPYWRDGPWNDPIDISLAVHLAFAVPTFFLWLLVVVRALRRFPVPPQPGVHSRWHRLWGTAAAVGMLMTAATGWLFYLLAFAAR
jgi:uncharacterized membrane protein YozB (DUF420 family)